MVKSVVEYIPSFLLAIFTPKWSHSGHATTHGFHEAVDATFVSENILSKHPMVYAIGTSFFQHVASMANHSQWSLPVPSWSTCGPASKVFVKNSTAMTVTYKCQHCKMQATFEKPEGVVNVKEGRLWSLDWDTYLCWVGAIKAKKWTHPTPKGATPHIEEPKTVEEYAARQMYHSSPFIVRVIGSMEVEEEEQQPLPVLLPPRIQSATPHSEHNSPESSQERLRESLEEHCGTLIETMFQLPPSPDEK